jgi:putative OmpL-like beta-barrel porin-2
MNYALVVVVVAASASARADDTPPKITLGGYVEMYYQLNLRTPSNHVTNLRGFDDRDRTFTLANVALDAKAERGALTVHLTLQIGETPTIYYAAEPNGGADLWKYLQQANIAYKLGDATIDGGLFPSPIGPEVIPIKDNWNWSRSNLFFGLPFYHTGVRVAYPLGGGWTGQLHVYNGWNSVVDNNDRPSIAASAAYAGDKLSGQLLYFGGDERNDGTPQGRPWRHLFDAYATYAITAELSVLAHADAGFERNNFGTSGWLAGALYAKYQLSPKLYVAARADAFREYVAERAQAIFWPVEWIGSGTATLALQPADGLSLRLEVRHDEAADVAFFGGDGGMDANRRRQDTITLGATGWF